MGPIQNLIDISMFDRIIMNVIHICLIFLFIAYLVFPEPSLPNSGLSVLEL